MRYTEFIKNEEFTDLFVEMIDRDESWRAIGLAIGITHKTAKQWANTLDLEKVDLLLIAENLWNKKQYKEAIKIMFNIDKHTGIFTDKIYRKGGKHIGSVSGYIRDIRGTKRHVIKVFGNSYYRSRLVLAYFDGLDIKDLNWMADHENHNTLDDSYSNLRKADNKENARNCKMRSDNTSGHIGVYRKNKTYDVIINGNTYGSGYTYEEACKKADEVYKELGYHKNHGRTQDELEADW